MGRQWRFLLEGETYADFSISTSPALERAVMEAIREQAVKDGMTTLMQDGIRKVLLGLTDLKQVRKVCIK
jgi:type II secretory ATPase GspE/PulE/Tfp pilus assembly ATPase PilB-like protein